VQGPAVRKDGVIAGFYQAGSQSHRCCCWWWWWKRWCWWWWLCHRQAQSKHLPGCQRHERFNSWDPAGLACQPSPSGAESSLTTKPKGEVIAVLQPW